MKKLLVLLTFLLFIQQSFSQNSWVQEMKEGKGFQEILKSNSAFRNKSKTTEKEGDWEQYQRWENYWHHRTLPDGTFPSAKFLADIYQSVGQNTINTRGQNDWNYFGPFTLPISDIDYYPGAGRINAVEINPNNPDELIAGAASSGIWKSIDKGNTWVSKTDDLPILGISDIVRDPENPLTLYAATGDADAGRHPGTGIIKTEDGGETWAFVGLFQPLEGNFTICRLAALPNNVLVATTFDGIYKSTDGALSWAKLTVSNLTKAYCIVQKPFSNDTLYVGSSDGKIFRSPDGGDTWAQLTLSSKLTNKGRIEIAVSPSNPNYVLAQAQKAGMAFSMDAGNTWTNIVSNPQGYSSQGGYDMALAVSPFSTDKIISAGVDGFRSLDGGLTWEKYLDGYWENGNPNFYVHSDHHVMKFFPNSEILLSGNDGGLNYGDINMSDPFIDISNGLYITQYYGLGLVNTDSIHVIAGAQDNDGVFFNDSGALGILPGSDGYDGMIDYNNPLKAYACTTGGGLMKTQDGWANFTSPSNNFNSNWDVQMKMNPINPSSIFLGGNTLVKSSDEGENFITLFNQSSEITGVDIAKSDTLRMYLQTESKGFYSSVNGGTTWLNQALPAGFTSSDVTDLAIDPSNPDLVYLTIGGFKSGQKVWMTVDGGVNWVNISFNLPNIPINCITTVNGKLSGEIYIGTDLGVWRLNPSVSIWESFNEGLPVIPISELNVNYFNGSLFAATYGRGIWSAKLESITVSTNSPGQVQDLNFIINPTLSKTGVFTVSSKDENIQKTTTIRIINMAGGILYYKNIDLSSQSNLDLSNLNAGTYLVQFIQGKNSQISKIIIAK